MPITPQIQEDRMRSLRFLFAGVFFVLVLIEKSMGFTPNDTKNFFPKNGFRNLGKQIETPKQTKDPFLSPDWEDDLAWEEEVLSHSIPLDPNGSSTKQRIVDDSIPEITLPEDRFPNLGSKLQIGAGYLPIYFLKFYGSGKNNQSQLVKVTREFVGGDPIPFLFQELAKGPNAEEKSKGILTAVSKKLKMDPSYKFHNGILHLDLSEEFVFGGSHEILRDRLDQIIFTFVGNYGITGVVLYANGERVRTLGSDGLNLPEKLVKNQRKVILF
ncbi:GerMN domain-containing protein [Leptospira sp. 96542]|nr:GerMN domain-containing protein [Leptospira sp. 96542]